MRHTIRYGVTSSTIWRVQPVPEAFRSSDAFASRFSRDDPPIRLIYPPLGPIANFKGVGEEFVESIGE